MPHPRHPPPPQAPALPATLAAHLTPREQAALIAFAATFAAALGEHVVERLRADGVAVTDAGPPAPPCHGLLTADEAAAFLQISRRSLSARIAAGDIRPHRVGRLLRFSPRSLQDYLERTGVRGAGRRGGRP